MVTELQSASEEDKRELDIRKIGNAALMRPLYMALVMGPMALFREEAVVKSNHYDWHDHYLYVVGVHIFGGMKCA
jgi:hypothetical protein